MTFEDSSRFSLDDLKVEEEEIRSPTIFPLSIFTSKTQFLKPVNDVEVLKEEIKTRLISKYSFKKRDSRKFKEGFLDINVSEFGIKGFYAKETPTKIMFEMNDMKIHEERLRLINPSFSVKMKISLSNNNAKVVLFGGSEPTMKKALININYCIRECIEGGHITSDLRFSNEEMRNMLKKLGTTVEYIWIAPGESKKFIKFVEKKEGGKVKKFFEYVVHAKLEGYHIIGSPITINLVEESGVRLKEIQAKILYTAGNYITVRISSSGRVLMFIPDALVPKGATVFDVGEEIYDRIIMQHKGSMEVTLDGFLFKENYV